MLRPPTLQNVVNSTYPPFILYIFFWIPHTKCLKIHTLYEINEKKLLWVPLFWISVLYFLESHLNADFYDFSTKIDKYNVIFLWETDVFFIILEIWLLVNRKWKVWKKIRLISTKAEISVIKKSACSYSFFYS